MAHAWNGELISASLERQMPVTPEIEQTLSETRFTEVGAFWRTGMLANQDPVTKLRQASTIEQVTAFGLDD